MAQQLRSSGLRSVVSVGKRWLNINASMAGFNLQGDSKMWSSILLVILILMLFGALPAWPHSRSWGYGPTGGLGLLILILLVLVLMELI